MSNGRRQKYRRRVPSYVWMIVLVALLAVVGVLMGITLKKLFTPEQPVPTPPVETEQQQPTDEHSTPVFDVHGEDEDETPEDPGPGMTETFRAQQGDLVLEFDTSKMELNRNDLVYTLTKKGSEDNTRLDLQFVEATMSTLSTETLDRVAIGLLQAYYYVAPETDAITITNRTEKDNEYRAELSAPATDTVEAVRAVVRIMGSSEGVWYAIVLNPEGTDAESLIQVMDAARIGSEN